MTTSQFVTAPKPNARHALIAAGLTTSQFVTAPKLAILVPQVFLSLTTSQFVTAPKHIDPHTFSAIWYALDTVTVADVKQKEFNSKRGE